jgi:hypothetical protein
MGDELRHQGDGDEDSFEAGYEAAMYAEQAYPPTPGGYAGGLAMPEGGGFGVPEGFEQGYAISASGGGLGTTEEPGGYGYEMPEGGYGISASGGGGLPGEFEGGFGMPEGGGGYGLPEGGEFEGYGSQGPRESEWGELGDSLESGLEDLERLL